jgi:hypothetical protein
MPEPHRRPKRLAMVMQLLPEDRITAHCACGRTVSISARKLQRRFPPKADFATVAASLVCRNCKARTPSLRCVHDDRVRWLYRSGEPRAAEEKT